MSSTVTLPSPSPSCRNAQGPHRPVIDPDTSLASALFGNNIGWFFLGFVALQTCTYYTRSTKDHLAFKVVVYFLVFLAVSETAIESYDAYIILTIQWGDATIIRNRDTYLFSLLSDLQPAFSAVPAIFVQFFFTWRIWTFSKATVGKPAKLLVAAICLFIILMSICAFVSFIIFILSFFEFQLSEFSEELPGTFVLVWGVSTAVADLTITICMLSILYHAKSSVYFGELNDRISRLATIIIRTGFLTSIFAIPIGPLFISAPVGLNALITFALGKSYLISLLANLNARSETGKAATVFRVNDDPASGFTATDPQVPAMAFNTSNQDPLDSNPNAIIGSPGVFPSFRSVAHTDMPANRTRPLAEFDNPLDERKTQPKSEATVQTPAKCDEDDLSSSK